MMEYAQRIVVEAPFETALGDLHRALREEGLQTLARIDLRDHFWRSIGRDFRCCFLVDAWSPALAFEALQQSLDTATVLPTTFAVYELAGGETAIAARQPFVPVVDERAWRQRSAALAAIADREGEHVARVLARVQHRFADESRSPAA